jgi:hypothetical protein
MSLFLRQSTAKVVSFGPFLDKTDGVTLEVGLVSALDHASTGIFLSKNGGALTIRHATVTASTYDAYGNYRVTLDTTDTDTIGTLRMQFSEAATCLPVWQDFVVLDEAVYDALFGTTALATATNITGGTITTVSAVTGLTASNLDATISSRASQTSVNTIDDFLDTEVQAILDAVDTEVAAIKAKTDSLTFTVAGKVDSNPTAINGDATSAANLAKTTRAIGRGTCDAGSTTTSVVTSAFLPVGVAANADQFKGRIITFDADTTTTKLRGQSTDITASSAAAAPTFTVTALTIAPASGDTFSVT